MLALWGLHRVTVSTVWVAIAVLAIGLMTSCGGGGGTAVGGQPPTDGQPPTNGQTPTGASLRWIAVPEGPDPTPRPYGMSADGQVVVGAVGPGGGERAFRWTPQGGLQLLENLGDDSEANGVSPDGSVVVGWASAIEGLVGIKPVWWDAQGKVHVLAESGEAWAASQGGQVIAGSLGSNNSVAVVWKNGQLRSLEVPGAALEVSADGTKVLGYDFERHELFVWSEDTGVRYLGLKKDEARLSADGSVIVAVHDEEGWSIRTSTGRTIPLQLPSGYDHLSVGGLSADGTTVVGAIYTRDIPEAARWTADGRVQNLNEVFADLLKDGSRLEFAEYVSADGRYIVGVGYNAATRRTEMFWLYTGGR